MMLSCALQSFNAGEGARPGIQKANSDVFSFATVRHSNRLLTLHDVGMLPLMVPVPAHAQQNGDGRLLTMFQDSEALHVSIWVWT